jgi:hypothetical protein
MDSLSLQEVSENLTFECVLCGNKLAVQRMARHAAAHTRRGECWSYASFDGASRLDGKLEGWPVVSPRGEEQLWPFWERTERLAAMRRHHAVAV